jgi:hypothetical protein
MSADTNVKIYFIAFSVADVFQDIDQVVDEGVLPGEETVSMCVVVIGRCISVIGLMA